MDDPTMDEPAGAESTTDGPPGDAGVMDAHSMDALRAVLAELDSVFDELVDIGRRLEDPGITGPARAVLQRRRQELHRRSAQLAVGHPALRARRRAQIEYRLEALEKKLGDHILKQRIRTFGQRWNGRRGATSFYLQAEALNRKIDSGTGFNELKAEYDRLKDELRSLGRLD